MYKERVGNGKRFLVCLLVMAGMTVIFGGVVCQAETITMAPHKIILNAQGQSDDFQAVINMSMLGGYSLSDYEVSLSFDGQFIALAESFRYCPIDDNFLAGFDREEVLNNPVVISMAGGMVDATVAGWFTAVNAEGDSYTREFSGTDKVEILAQSGDKKGETNVPSGNKHGK
jgi:hypothetical protein